MSELKVIDYMHPKTGEVLERPGGRVWAVVKWHNGLTQTLKYDDVRQQFKGKNRYELRTK